MDQQHPFDRFAQTLAQPRSRRGLLRTLGTGLVAAAAGSLVARTGGAHADSGPCATGLTLCGTLCKDLQNDPQNCGACGTALPPGGSCINGHAAPSYTLPVPPQPLLFAPNGLPSPTTPQPYHPVNGGDGGSTATAVGTSGGGGGGNTVSTTGCSVVCPAGTVCSSDGAHCCPPGTAGQWCAGTCCAAGQICLDGACTPLGGRCGSSTCTATEVCVAGACCPAPLVCQSNQGGPATCCAPGQTCSFGQCCNALSVCGRDCCSGIQVCTANGGCCTPAAVCGEDCCDLARQTCIGNACCDFADVCGNVCCQNGDQCINGQCCQPGNTCGASCCPSGQVCTNGQCCPQGKTCLGACCTASQTCLNNACCETRQICDGVCCPTGQSCVNHQCCAPGDVCGPSGSQVCCGANTPCSTDNVACCQFGTSGKYCADGLCCDPATEACIGGFCCPTLSICGPSANICCTGTLQQPAVCSDDFVHCCPPSKPNGGTYCNGDCCDPATETCVNGTCQKTCSGTFPCGDSVCPCSSCCYETVSSLGRLLGCCDAPANGPAGGMCVTGNQGNGCSGIL